MDPVKRLWMWFCCKKLLGKLFDYLIIPQNANGFSRYNELLISIRISLIELQKGIKGLVVMSSDLEEIFLCIYDGRVPSPWLKGEHIFGNKNLLIYCFFSISLIKIVGLLDTGFDDENRSLLSVGFHN